MYLPTEWLDAAGLSAEDVFADPRPGKAIRAMVRRLVMDANRLYMRSEAGISALPLKARTGIFAARLIYGGIGREVQKAGYDTISTRAHTSKGQKLGWIAQAALRTGVSVMMPQSAVVYARPLPQVAFLVDAAARKTPTRPFWGDDVLAILSDLKAREQMDKTNIVTR
jgi:phytoene synthase